MEVVVVGAGIIGCAVAYEVASRGARVRLLEKRDVGLGATQASAGVLCPYIEGHAAPLLDLTVHSLDLYDAFIERVRRDSGEAVEYRRTGTLEVALDEPHRERLDATAARYRAAQVDHQLLSAAEAREFERSLAGTVTAALFVPSHGYVAASALTRALAVAARRRGVTIQSATTVRRIEAAGRGVRVTLADQSIETDAVVLAAGSWSGDVVVTSAPSAPVKPIRGQLLLLHCGAPAAERVVWGSDCYLVPWADGSLLVGATVEDVGFDESATAAAVRDLLDAACDLLPSVWTARFHEARAGLRPATSDELPIIGCSATIPGLVYATGHYRNGVMLAPLTATAVADLLLEGTESPHLATTRPSRFGL